MNELRQWVVAADQNGLRLDSFLAASFSSYSRREIIALISAGRIFLNGRPAKKGERIRVGDTITAPAALLLCPNATLPITVVHADDTLVVFDKPAGIPSLALRHDETQTVANFLLASFPETSTIGSRPLESGLVHRLDTSTSGLLLAARTPFAYSSLREQ
ncbi:MAG: S4 domain-containing protein, partial [Candidatus Binatia bacterium]